MLFAKRFDFYGQLVLIFGFLVLTFIQAFDTSLSAFLIIGGWQMLSALIHFFNRHHLLRSSGRYYYEIALLVGLAAELVLVVVSNFSVNYTLALLWCVLPMAIWYCYLTFSELRTWEARALIHLK